MSSILETLDENLEPDLAYLKIFDTGRKVTVHKHEGHIQARIVYYLMNVRITPRTIYLTRHGESYNNVIGIQYRHSTISAVSISAIFDLMRFIILS